MRALVLLLLLIPGLAQSQPQSSGALDAAAWLQKIYHASVKLSYSGTFVYRQGQQSESSHIVRLVDGTGDTEKLEALDGMRREVVRKGDEVRCYLPDSLTVKVDRRSDHRSFPSLLPARISALSGQYTISKGETTRIAGFDCQAIVLKPKDNLRYGYKLWADTRTGMLLKARIFNEKDEAVEEFTFTQLTIGGKISPKDLKPSFNSQGKEWRVVNASVEPANLADAGWKLSADIPGFRKVVEVRRHLRESQRVAQVVYSDGLAAVSVFIEPMETHHDPVRTGLSNMGAVNIYTRELANHVVTVLGEAPPITVRRIANAIEYHRPQ